MQRVQYRSKPVPENENRFRYWTNHVFGHFIESKALAVKLDSHGPLIYSKFLFGRPIVYDDRKNTA